jgi:hypothetical protein
MLPRAILTAAIVLGAAGTAAANPINLVTNGSFETITGDLSGGEIVPGQTGTYISSAAGWYSTSTTANGGDPFLFIALPHTADSTGFGDQWDNGLRHIWGPNDGSNNGFTGVSPDGGNMLIADGDYHDTAISQNIATTLVVGQYYTIGFWWAAAQWSLNSGATNEAWQVSLGNSTFNTSTVQLASHGFSGWIWQNYTFLYTGGANALSFLAVSSSTGEPPILLLDGVTLSVPEPAAWAMLLTGVAVVGAAARRRKKASASF